MLSSNLPCQAADISTHTLSSCLPCKDQKTEQRKHTCHMMSNQKNKARSHPGQNCKADTFALAGGHLQRCQVEDGLAGVAALGQGLAPGGLEVLLPLGLHHVLLHQHALHKQQSLGHVTPAACFLHCLQHVGMPRQPCLPLHPISHVCKMPASYFPEFLKGALCCRPVHNSCQLWFEEDQTGCVWCNMYMLTASYHVESC